MISEKCIVLHRLKEDSVIEPKQQKRFLTYRLQYFADGSGGEKTEDATSKKLSDARSEGQVARSTDLITAASLFGLFLTLKIFMVSIKNNFISTFNLIYGNLDKLSREDFTNVTGQLLLQETIIIIIKIILPVLIIGFLVAFLLNLTQVKWKISSKPLKPKLSGLNPIKGVKKLFSKDKIVELIKETLKIIAIIYIVYNILTNEDSSLLQLYDMDLNQAIIFIGNIIIKLGFDVSIVFLMIGFGDYFYQKLKFKKDMKMSKQEVKDEFKQTEGDPQVKGKIRAKMREASQRRMMQKLPEADVIITNPTHFAAAIKYDKEAAEAPILLAKGADYLAEKIKEVARENKIEIVENKPLARMLYYNVEIGSEIPPELYQMTAEVLAYVYALKNKYSPK
ncbi:MAG: hypothetical protein K0R92_42 [Lachnospiraceae bacterium]|jgi:flagellar biosynthetic protein FlhB|nr:hypothetical protein [Lachnospiraceae bacterium]